MCQEPEHLILFFKTIYLYMRIYGCPAQTPALRCVFPPLDALCSTGLPSTGPQSLILAHSDSLRTLTPRTISCSVGVWFCHHMCSSLLQTTSCHRKLGQPLIRNSAELARQCFPIKMAPAPLWSRPTAGLVPEYPKQDFGSWPTRRKE